MKTWKVIVIKDYKTASACPNHAGRLLARKDDIGTVLSSPTGKRDKLNMIFREGKRNGRIIPNHYLKIIGHA